ncbi:hypothetical protein O6H91_15G052700 [Diphasiastrum complanatum]|uniref:Uncharacterized protein n=1 Tax=Diphasiastrum complanatum TaxID=34168 RepID=A0ACC2BI97_DIPCM|nr:hypothetical protein O6H91_15G052700 [Diphasiastrum complanatum]
MFDNWHLRPFAQPGIDIYQIIREAQTRWLRPVEVIEILRNHQIFRLNPVPPNKPPSGSLFLFDRKTLRFFRKDGHNWRKKKDGKTVREAHERLKAGSIDILHCYYAHGEDNVNFQRRSYWMLEGAYEHIVLVHYREVTEGSRTCVVRTVNEIKEPPISATERDSHSQSLISTQPRPPESLPQPHGFSSPETSEVEVTGPYQSPESAVDSALPEIEEIDSGEEVEEILAPVLGASEEQHSSLLQQLSAQNEKDTYLNHGSTSKEWPSSATFSSGIGHDFQLHTPLSQSKSVIPSKGGPDLPQRPHYINHKSDKQLYINPSVAHLENASTVQLDDSSQNPERFLAQPVLPSATFDISGWNMLLENFRGSGTPQGSKMPWKQDFKSPTWADILEKAMISPAENNRYNILSSKGSDYPMHRDDISCEPTVSQSSQHYAHASAPANTQDARESQLDCIVQTNPSGAAAKLGTFKAPMTSQLGSGMTSDQFLHDRLRQEEQLLTMKEMLSSNQSDPNFWQQKPRHEYSQEENHDQELRAFQQEQSLVFNGSLDPQLGRFPSSPLPLAMEDAEQCKQGGLESFKKLDSFGRWMSAMGEDSEGSLISGSYWAASLDGPGPVELMSSFSQQMQMDVGLSPSLAQEQRFSITDFAPEWTFSSGGSKVVIVGDFLDRGRTFSECTWCCMFGEIEVPAEVIQVGVLRCKAPPHEPGRVPFYITCRDRLACSEIREFEYRIQNSTCLALSSGSSDSLISNSQDIRSSSLLVRFARLLSSKPDEALAMDSLWSKEELGSAEKICYLTSNSDEEWRNLDSHAKGLTMPSSDVKEQVVQILFKQKLQDWLLRKVHEENKGVCVFDNEGQGVLHLAATLGYDWAVAPILAAGVGVNFRDFHGWTALHWAASYGREKVVLALLAAGAAPGLLTDPTPNYPSGRTPADLAATSGHGGMAGYLAEMSLTTHLSSLALKEKNMNEIEAFSAALAEEKAMDYLSERTNLQQKLQGDDEQITLQGSLRAVRNAARAAALIQATFRRHSFRKREECSELEVLDDYTMSQEEIKSMVAAHKIQKAYPGFRKEKLHAAAVQIQCKFRSWKGRKDFLTLRQRVVKIQAHVRGHQVRSKCRKLLWSVGILEKAVLRWRRKGTGLRGFRAESTFSGSNVQDGSQSDGVEDVLRAGRKEKEVAIQNAVTRVQSMVKSDEARAQYWRLVEGYRQSTTVEDSGLTSDVSSNHANPSQGTEDYIMFGET